MEEVWKEAFQSRQSLHLSSPNSESITTSGIQIIKDSNESYTIVRCNSDNYTEINETDYKLFHTYGWTIGVYKLLLKDCTSNLDYLEQRIQISIGYIRNKKMVDSLKKKRMKVLKKYSQINKKLYKHEQVIKNSIPIKST